MAKFNKRRSYFQLFQCLNVRLSITEVIVENPLLGEPKKGDLAGVYVYKFKCVNQEFLLAYEFDKKHHLLLALGVYENFYRDLKKSQ